MPDMFVVLEWNQASHQPRVACDDIYDTAAEARDRADELRALLHPGRRERFTIHQLEDVDE